MERERGEEREEKLHRTRGRAIGGGDGGGGDEGAPGFIFSGSVFRAWADLVRGVRTVRLNRTGGPDQFYLVNLDRTRRSFDSNRFCK